MTSRSASTSKPISSATCRNNSLCCPVATTVQSKSMELRSAATTGASLIASGRVPMNTRIVLRAFTGGPHAASFGSPIGRGPPQPSRDDLASQKPEELAVGEEVPLPHLARLHAEPPGPLHPDRLHPSWRALHVTRQDVEATSDPHD